MQPTTQKTKTKRVKNENITDSKEPKKIPKRVKNKDANNDENNPDNKNLNEQQQPTELPNTIPFVDYLKVNSEKVVVLPEKWDYDKLQKLIKNGNLHKNYKKLYEQILKEIEKYGNDRNIKYQLPKKAKKDHNGRLAITRDHGYMRGPSSHRRFLSSELYYDIDIVKCQPTLLWNIGRTLYNTQYNAIDNYSHKFDEICTPILEKYPDFKIIYTNDYPDSVTKESEQTIKYGKDAIKHVVNTISNGCNYKKKFNITDDIQFFMDYKQEIDELYEQIC